MTYVVLSNHRFYEKDMIVSLETKKILLRLVLLLSSVLTAKSSEPGRSGLEMVNRLTSFTR